MRETRTFTVLAVGALILAMAALLAAPAQAGTSRGEPGVEASRTAASYEGSGGHRVRRSSTVGGAAATVVAAAALSATAMQRTRVATT